MTISVVSQWWRSPSCSVPCRWPALRCFLQVVFIIECANLIARDNGGDAGYSYTRWLRTIYIVILCGWNKTWTNLCWKIKAPHSQRLCYVASFVRSTSTLRCCFVVTYRSKLFVWHDYLSFFYFVGSSLWRIKLIGNLELTDQCWVRWRGVDAESSNSVEPSNIFS